MLLEPILPHLAKLLLNNFCEVIIMRYIGVDLHKTSIVACYLDDGTFSHKSFKIQDIDKFKATLSLDDEMCFETTTNSKWFHQQCNDSVSRIVVVNTNEFGAISASVRKTDKHDAKTLVIYLSKNMLPEVKVKSNEHQGLQSIFTARKLITKQVTMIKNQIHGILLGQGLIISPYDLDSELGIGRIHKLCANSDILLAITPLTEILMVLTKKIAEFNQTLEKLGPLLPGYKNLKSIKGLGTNTIVLLLSTVGNIANFETHNKLSSYIGFVPKVRNSNNSIKHGAITKRGNSLLRGNLTMCALVAIQHNALLNSFYLRIKAKGGHKKAIVATANKLVKIIFYTLKYNWYFTDFCKHERETLTINW